MNLRTKRIILILIPAVVVVAVALLLNRAQWRSRNMAEYAPATAAGFIQIDNLATVLSGVVETDAWRRLAPALGLSSQLNYLGSSSDFLAYTGLGPDEAVLLARAQYALVISGLEAETKPSAGEEAQQLEIVPRLALIIETHADAARVEKHLTTRLPLLARRIYGREIDESEQQFQGTRIKTYKARSADRQLVAAQTGSVLLIGNHFDSVQSCLDVIINKRARLSDDANLQLARARLGKDSAAFAFLNGTAVARLAQLGSLFIPGGPDEKSDGRNRAQLAGALSDQIIKGAAYSARFESGRVSEHYLVLMRPELAANLRAAIQPAAVGQEIVALASGTNADFTLLRVQKPAESLERLVTTISTQANVVVSFALRQLMIELSRQYGLEPDERKGALIGNEIAMVKIPLEDNNFAVVAEVSDKARMLPVIARYLRRDKGAVRSEQYGNAELVTGSGQGERAAAFIGKYIALGHPVQLKRVIDAQRAPQQGIIDAIAQMTARHNGALVIFCNYEQQAAAELMLGVSRLLRTTDGARELLESPNVKAATAQLPPSLSVLEIGDEGILMTGYSPLGPLVKLAPLLTDPAGELQESISNK